MYNQIITVERPVKTIRLFRGSSQQARQLMDNFAALRAAAPGFVETFTVLTEDELKLTRTVVWNSKVDYDNFMAANAAVWTELDTARDAYEAAHGITRTVQFV